MPIVPIAAASLLGLLLSMASIDAAQQAPPADAGPAKAAHVVLMQLTLRLSAIPDPAEQARRVAEFQAAAKAMTQCDDAAGVAKDLGVEFIGARDVPLSSVPPALQTELAAMPIGTATHMFGQRDQEARVLLLCGRSEQ